MNKNKKLFLSFIFLFSFLVIPHFVQAGFLDSLNTPKCIKFDDKGQCLEVQTCIDDGLCSLDDVAQGFIALTQFLIGAIGALALLYFIWGGIQWLTSYGNQQKIQKGREIMLQTVIALVIAFMSYILVEFFVNDLLHGQQCVQFDKATGECTQYKAAIEVDPSSDNSTNNSSSCANKTEGTACNTGQANYVCSGGQNNQCMTKCELKSSKDPGYVWACGTALPGDITEPYLCPGDATNVCKRGDAR